LGAAAERQHVSQMHKSYPKQMRKELRELAALAYERELGRHLAELEVRFSEWVQHKISAHELSDRIHEFHDGPSRDLFSVNQQFKPDFLVSRALATGVLNESEIPSDILKALSNQIESLKSIVEDDGTG
jgi:hypothetical protein